MRELMRATLEPDFEVRGAESAEHGLELLREENPALILLDLRMPGMGGIQFIREARAQNPGKQVPIVVMTASQQDCPEALEEGASGYILKPFNALDLKMQVAVHMNRHSGVKPA